MVGYNQVQGPHERKGKNQTGKWCVVLKLNNQTIPSGYKYFPTKEQGEIYAAGARALAHQRDSATQLGAGNERWRRLDWWVEQMALETTQGTDPRRLQAMAIAVKEARACVAMLGMPSEEEDDKNVKALSYDELKAKAAEFTSH